MAAAPTVAGAIEEIIVTTQKREQSLQDVPVAVSAYNEDFLSQTGVKDFRDLVSMTPGLKGGTDDGFIDALGDPRNFDQRLRHWRRPVGGRVHRRRA